MESILLFGQTISRIPVYSDFLTGIDGFPSPQNVVIQASGLTYHAFDLINYIKRRYNLEHPELGGDAFPTTTYVCSEYDPRTPEPHVTEQKFFEVCVGYQHGESYGMSIGFKIRDVYTMEPAPVTQWNEQADYTWIDYLYDDSTQYDGIDPTNIVEADHFYHMLYFMHQSIGEYNMPADPLVKTGIMWRVNAYEKLYAENPWTNVGADVNYLGANLRDNSNIEGPDYYPVMAGYPDEYRYDCTGGIIYNYGAPYPYSISYGFSYAVWQLLDVCGDWDVEPEDIPKTWFDNGEKPPELPEEGKYKPDGYEGNNPEDYDLPSKSILSSGMFQLYIPDTPNLRQLSQWLWSSDSKDAYDRWGMHAMDAIVMLGCVPFDLSSITGSSSNIQIMGEDTGVSCPVATQAWYKQTLGAVTIDSNKLSGSYLDFSNSSISMFVPCVGIVPLKASDVINSSIAIWYRVDLLSGDFIAYLSVTRYDNTMKQIIGGPYTLYSFTGNCMQLYPLSSANYAQYYMSQRQNLMNIVGQGMGMVGDALSMMNPFSMGESLSNMGQRVSSMWDSMDWLKYQTPEVTRSGSYTGGLAHLGRKIPYIIIDHARPYRYQLEGSSYNGFYKWYGYPTMRTMKLSDCAISSGGYTEVARVRVNIPKATTAERIEIENLLKSGVVIKTPSN